MILMFILCVNLAVGLVLGLALPGTEYVSPQSPSVDTESDYETTFNATEVVETWEIPRLTGIDAIDYITGTLSIMWRCFTFLIDGFPQMLDWIGGTFVLDADGLAAFEVIKWVWRALFVVTMTFFVLEYVSGRNASD